MSDSPHVLEATAETFDAIVQRYSAQVPVVADFWADWCAPCKMLMPVLEQLVNEYRGNFVLVKVNTDEQQELALREGIRSLPTLKIYKNGAAVDELHGAQPAAVLREAIDRHVTRESHILRARAQEADQAGDPEGALRLLEQAAAMEPDNAQLAVERARMLLRVGRLNEARVLADGLPAEVRGEPPVGALLAELEFTRAVEGAPDLEALEEAIAGGAGDSDTRYRLGARKALAGDYEGAMDQFLQIMQRDRAFGDDAGRRALLGVFDLLGREGKLVHRYRKRMFAALH
ncbi:MAG: thioredoxin [Gammaproteobacteria bacterium]|nr:thioredoxin [Gammaproteobacteria bacterium]NIR96760.1 thioredoxin [Gammaproteobacteria bacterium]NIT62462.1 thioredoxin [Gammaproteobacteria bacterium]NIV19395.1 thioredoxin [Gammaproteobacteria bacterium]NIX10466.1 thioredoxin [Gammaproteobacteria bacterium]